MDVQAGLDADGRIGSWHMVNINSGRAALETPYQIARTNHQYVESQAPLRHGSYRALAATANAFARECAMDELAMIAQQDPLAFRLRHIENARLRDVLVAAAEKSGWSDRETGREPNAGMGLACATEKGSYVGTCAQAAVDPRTGKITVRRIVLAFECGAIINPDNLLSQVQGCIVMALGPALREEIQFSDGSIQNASFAQYAVPRFADVPKLDIHLLDRRDLPSVGAGETPLIAVAPAIANAIFAACGQRVRALPMRLATGAAPTR
jgi:isoquinoline 1-oxidoreductase